MRNNINIDLLENRDSLKTILLMLAFNLDIIQKREMNNIIKKGE